MVSVVDVIKYILLAILVINVAAVCIFIISPFFSSLCSIFIKLIDKIYINIHKVKNICPNPACQAMFLIPVYGCPKCDERKAKFVLYQVFKIKRRCSCGNLMPMTCWTGKGAGRGERKHYCPKCDIELSGDTATCQYIFPVVGGISVGKTCFINQTIHQIINGVAPNRKWEISFVSKSAEEEHSLAMESLKQGKSLQKTESILSTPYQLTLKLPARKTQPRLCLYDVSGELFSNTVNLQNNLAYRYADGFVFIIDPLAIEQFVKTIENDTDLKTYAASSMDAAIVLNILILGLEQLCNLSNTEKIYSNLAVVINKVDIPVLEEKIGVIAIQQYLEDNAKTCKTYADACHEVCRNFLSEFGADNFIRLAETKFKEVKYFACSAFAQENEKQDKESQPQKEINVVNPIMWLLQSANPKILEPQNVGTNN